MPERKDIIGYVLYYHPKHMERLAMLFGLCELIKSKGCKSFAELVNLYKVKPKHFHHIAHYLSIDDSFDQVIEDEFMYNIIIELRLLDEQLEKDPNVILDWRDMM